MLCKLHLLHEAGLKAQCIIILFAQVNKWFCFICKKFSLLYEPVHISQTRLWWAII